MQTDIFPPSQAIIHAAINAAAWAAIEQARRTGTNLAVWKDGKVAEITPDEAEAEFYAGSKTGKPS